MTGDGATIEELDAAAAAAAAFENLRLELVRRAVDLCANEGWKRSGARTLATWLAAYSGIELPEARRIAKVARLASRHSDYATAVLTGTLSYGRAELLASYASGDREELLDGSLETILAQNLRLHRYDDWSAMVAHWASLVDQELSAPPRAHRHELHVSQSLFGGGEIHGWLDPEALITVTAGLEAFMPSPDPMNGPVTPRTPAERQADALTDMAAWGLGGMALPADNSPHEPCGDDPDTRPAPAEHTDAERAPVARPRSGVTANVVIDLRTFAGDRRFDDLEGFDLRADRWTVSRSVAEQLLCDSGLVATLLAGRTTLLDASDRSEQFTAAQRRALAVRDGGCTFPGCDRPPKHCDAHHLHARSAGGHDATDNAALQCRHHHRLLHRGWRLRFEDDVGRWIATDPTGIDWDGRPRGPTPSPN